MERCKGVGEEEVLKNPEEKGYPVVTERRLTGTPPKETVRENGIGVPFQRQSKLQKVEREIEEVEEPTVPPLLK